MLVECDPGFFGENCSSTCPPGYFGLKCREPCNCSPDKYCDPIRRCVCNTTSVNCTESGIIPSYNRNEKETQGILLTQKCVYISWF